VKLLALPKRLPKLDASLVSRLLQHWRAPLAALSQKESTSVSSA
jgi:hypothetical protein